MRTKIASILFAMLIISCESDPPHYDLPDNEIFQYDAGDYLIYKSNLNNVDTLIVHSVYRDYWSDNAWGGYSAAYYEHQEVTLYFPEDVDSINFNQSWPNDLRIRFSGSVDPIDPATYFLWKRDLRIDFEDQDTFDNIIINGVRYDNVYILHRPAELADTLSMVKEIHLNYKSGMLKYEYADNEVFEFVGKL